MAYGECVSGQKEALNEHRAYGVSRAAYIHPQGLDSHTYTCSQYVCCGYCTQHHGRLPQFALSMSLLITLKCSLSVQISELSEL